VVEATSGAAGSTQVTYTVTAQDDVDGIATLVEDGRSRRTRTLTSPTFCPIFCDRKVCRSSAPIELKKFTNW
jgi:hypothetical protein